MDFNGLFARNIHPEIAGLVRSMGDLADEGGLPRRDRFDAEALGIIGGYVFLIDYLADEQDWQFNLFGDRIAVLFGANLLGMRLSEVGDAALRYTLRRTYDRVFATHLPLFMRGRYVWPETFIPIERLLIPMAGSDGQLTAICGISVPTIADADLALYAGEGAAQLVGDDELVLAA